MEKERTKLPLLVDDKPLYVISDDIKAKSEELEQFLEGMPYMNSKMFSKNVLYSHEIQANNNIEGYSDDVDLIDSIILRKKNISDEARRLRIINLYNGYRYILNNKEINKDNLKELYRLLSDGLLDEEDKANMGEYYRNEPVYIFFSDRLDVEPDKGVDPERVEEYMNILFDYINSNNDNLSSTEKFIKSQIMHFYFVYIHPYFDINGRTSRTTAMWYLLNHKDYPFIIFNRAIQMHKNEYYKVIRDVKKFKNVSFFLNYMLNNVHFELEKEHFMEVINQNTPELLTSTDYQTMSYILSMRSTLTYSDFAQFYNLRNEKKNKLTIYNEMLLPLVEKGIIIEKDFTRRGFSGVHQNRFFELNKALYDDDPAKIKLLHI